jgi:hypothetical protein
MPETWNVPLPASQDAELLLEAISFGNQFRNCWSRMNACWINVDKWDGYSGFDSQQGITFSVHHTEVQASWNAMAHAQKPDFVFRRKGRVHLNRRGRQFIRLLAAKLFASAVVMLDTPCSEIGWRVLATHSICQFTLHFPSRASPYAITFQLDCTTGLRPGD